MKLPAIAFTQEMFSRFGEVMRKEWLITNGLGGYASSTVLGINTRKYHGLLVAALHPPGNRTLCVSKLDEDVLMGNDVYRLGANEFTDAIYPQGYKLLKTVSVAPFPAYLYSFSNVEVNKTVFMPKKKNAVSVIYKVSNENSFEAKLRIYPILTCRYFHTVTDRFKNPFGFTQKSVGKELEVAFQLPEATMLCRSTDGEFKEKIKWVEHLYYRMEASRGEASSDDCFQPGYFEVAVPAQEQKEFAVSFAVNHENQMARDTLSSVGNTIDEVNASLSRELTQQSNMLEKFYGLH